MRIETARLLLRRPVRADAGALESVYGDAEVMRYIGDGTAWPHGRIVAALVRWNGFWDDDGFGLFVVERREDGALVGDVGILAWDPTTWSPGSRARIGPRAETEIGWTLARAHWGNGYATEAAVAVRDWALGELALARLISLIQPGNERSIRVAEKLGERYERDVVTHGGQPAHLYSLQAPA
jgi:RimJ/RimL family protein N-acetyltransferase